MQTESPHAEPPKNKRRWLQFGLRSLLIGVALLAIPCGYVGWQAKIVRERKAMLDAVVEAGGGYRIHVPKSRVLVTRTGGFVEVEPPLMRRWFGDEGVFDIHVSEPLFARRKPEFIRLYPEACVIIIRDLDRINDWKGRRDYP
jgi:hypothetical protein